MSSGAQSQTYRHRVRDGEVSRTRDCCVRVCKYKGLVLRRFTFTTLIESDGALTACGASLSQLKRPFCTKCASSPFPVCVRFLFFYFSAVLLSWLYFFPPTTSIKKTDCPLMQKRVKRTRKTVTLENKMLLIKKWKLTGNVLIWPSNENYVTNCDNLDMLIKEIRKNSRSWSWQC